MSYFCIASSVVYYLNVRFSRFITSVGKEGADFLTLCFLE